MFLAITSNLKFYVIVNIFFVGGQQHAFLKSHDFNYCGNTADVGKDLQTGQIQAYKKKIEDSRMQRTETWENCPLRVS